MNWPANPLDVLRMTLRATPIRYRLYKTALAQVDRDDEFARQILASKIYWSLIREGLPGDILFELCVLLHVMTHVRESALIEIHREGGRLKRGRPGDFFPLFQLLCFMLASRYGRGRQFRAEFSELTYLVFGKRITVDSYRTSLKRARAAFLATTQANTQQAVSLPRFEIPIAS